MTRAFSILVFLAVSIICNNLSASEAIAVWAYPDRAIVSGTINVGVVAYHSTGIDRVDFDVDGGTVISVTSETINPETNEYEYVLVLNTTGLTDNSSHTVHATAYPKTGTGHLLPDLVLEVENTVNHSTWYVDADSGSDAANGSAATPFLTTSKAYSSASGGDVIKLRTGEYELDISSDYHFDKFVTLMPDDGAEPKITSGNIIRSGFIKFVDIEFDYSQSGFLAGAIIQSYTNPHFWIRGCTFKGTPAAFNNYLAGLRFYSASDNITVENCRFIDLDKGLGVYHRSIARNNEISQLTHDAINFGQPEILISNNVIHDLGSLWAYIQSRNREPFDLSGNKVFSFFHDEYSQNGSNYTEYAFTDLGSAASDPSQATTAEIIAALEADAAFASARLTASDEGGYLRITAQTRNYKQYMYITGSANTALDFAEEGADSAIFGTGQHVDVFQNSNLSLQENLVIRNNRVYGIDGQGLLIQSTSVKNFAFVNNMIIHKTGSPWSVMLGRETSDDYDNILIEHNTLWEMNNTFSIRTTTYNEFYVRNNIFGYRTSFDEVNGGGLQIDYNLYDTWYGTVTLGNHSLQTNTANNIPTQTQLFADVTATQIGGTNFDFAGDFHVHENSPARDIGTSASGIFYDLDWSLRDSLPDIGAYEYGASGIREFGIRNSECPSANLNLPNPVNTMTELRDMIPEDAEIIEMSGELSRQPGGGIFLVRSNQKIQKVIIIGK